MPDAEIPEDVGGDEALEATLARLASEWRGTFDAIALPIVLVDTRARITRLNRAAQQLAGLRFKEILGLRPAEVASRSPWPEMDELATARLEHEQCASRHVRDDDRERHWHLTASRLPGAGAPAEPLVVIAARDVTDVVRLERSLRQAEAMSVMGALVASVAHDVRSPLFAISATLDALEVRLDAPERHTEHLARLRSSIACVLRLMNDLLEYGKPRALETSECDVAEVIHGAIAPCQGLAAEQNVRLVVRAAGPLAPTCLDRDRFGQAVRNLVDNAVQHSPRGAEVTIAMRTLHGDGGTRLVVEVADAGSGFREHELRRVFEPFFTRRQGGTGLGLSIVERIVEAHGGSVTAENGPAGGAIIRMSIPSGRGASAAAGRDLWRANASSRHSEESRDAL